MRLKRHTGHRDICRGPGQGIIVNVSLMNCMKILHYRDRLLRFVRRSIGALLIFPRVIVIHFRGVYTLNFSMLLHGVVKGREASVPLGIRGVVGG